MADEKITDLTAYTTPIATDVLPIVDVTTDTTKKITVANLKAAVSSNAATSGMITHDTAVTTTTTIAHGLGRTPVKVTFDFINFYSTVNGSGHGVYTSGSQSSICGTPDNSYLSDSTHGILLALSTASSGVGIKGTVSVDATNITIVWTDLPSGHGNGSAAPWPIIWDAI